MLEDVPENVLFKNKGAAKELGEVSNTEGVSWEELLIEDEDETTSMYCSD